MTVDLTTITCPFGLLDEVYGPGTQEALKNSGGPYEVFDGKFWQRSGAVPSENGYLAYRVKPAPREWWAVGAHMHTSEAEAQAFLAELNAKHPEMNFGPITRVREVLE